MHADHEREHEELLERWLAEGEIAAEDRSRLLACAVCASEARSADELFGRLAREGQRAREDVVQRAHGHPAPSAEARTETTLRGLMQADRPRNGRRFQGRWPWLALAAALAAAVFLPELWRGERDPRVLLGNELEAEQPRGEVEDFERFAWKCELNGVRYFTLEHWPAGGEREDATLVPHLDAAQRSWTPEPERLTAMPDRIWWRVAAYDAGGQLIEASESVEAWRRSP